MDKIEERISYLQGLGDGLGLFQEKKEGRFYDELTTILSELNQSLRHVSGRLSELEEYVEAIDEDLNDMEWDYYDGEFEDEYIEDDFIEDSDDAYMDENYYQVVCPNCHETVMVSHDSFEDDDVEEVVCPNCEEVLIIDSDDSYVEEEV